MVSHEQRMGDAPTDRPDNVAPTAVALALQRAVHGDLRVAASAAVFIAEKRSVAVPGQPATEPAAHAVRV